MTALAIEMKSGLRVGRGRSALAGAKALTGLATNNKQKQIDALRTLLTQLESRVTRE